MIGETRDPRGAAASGASTVGWSGLVGYALTKFLPDLTPLDVTMILGGVLLVVHAAGKMARDYVHEKSDAPFLVRQAAKLLG